MCDKKCECQHPEKKKDPAECSTEQIQECHGEGEGHPCKCKEKESQS